MKQLKPLKKEQASSLAVQQKSSARSLPAADTGINFTIQKKENKTGLPDQLKSGIESLSGHAMDDVKVHYNSPQPALLNAHAYAQGNQIHVAPGQEKHLAHEAWHVVQQKQGRVKPTKQLKSAVAVNDDAGLEKEADVMGAKALQTKYNPVQKVQAGHTDLFSPDTMPYTHNREVNQFVVQRMSGQSEGVVQMVLGNLPGMAKQFVSGMWKATTWEGLADNLNFMVKLVTELISAKGTAAKIAALGTSFIASTIAAVNSGKKKDWYKVVNHATKALTTLGAIYWEWYGGNVTAKILIMLIDQTAKKLPDIVAAVKAGYNNVNTHPHADQDLHTISIV